MKDWIKRFISPIIILTVLFYPAVCSCLHGTAEAGGMPSTNNIGHPAHKQANCHSGTARNKHSSTKDDQNCACPHMMMTKENPQADSILLLSSRAGYLFHFDLVSCLSTVLHQDNVDHLISPQYHVEKSSPPLYLANSNFRV